MKKSYLATASAIALLSASPAFADDNDAALLQTGTSNSVLVDQGGDDNQTALRQIGNGNEADILQEGNRNIGSRVAGPNGLGQALRQEGDNNNLDLVQNGNRNRVGTRGAGFDQLGDRNVADVDQVTNRNTLGVVQQQGQAGAAAAQNALTVLQNGGNRNFISATRQTNTDANGVANEITANQNGTGNIIGSITGSAGGLSQSGTGNSMVLNQTGDFNGAADTATAPRATGIFSRALSSASVDQGSASQTGASNTLTYDATGDLNLFGTAQTGNDNTIDMDQQGDRNEAAAEQFGDNNLTTVFQSPDGNSAASVLIGSSNTSDIAQNGDDNTATDSVVGSMNTLSTNQLGDENQSANEVAGNGNALLVTQTSVGGPNDSFIAVDGNNGQGDDNDIVVTQFGINTSTVDIFGDRSDVDVTQLGRNESRIEISGSPEGDDNIVLVDQANFGLFGANNSDVNIAGDNNDLALTQFLGANTLSIVIDGDTEGSDNVVSSFQSGFNEGILGISGDNNLVNLVQDGFNARNRATVIIDGAFNEGDANTVDIAQRSTGFGFYNGNATVNIGGDRNDIDLVQTGRNSATVTIAGMNSGEGDDNKININQNYSGGFFGSANTITATIYGSDNNKNLSFTGPDAIAVAGSLTPGDMFQSGGSGNNIELNVGDALLDSNANAFAFSQTGSNNTIIGSIRGGDANQVAVVQVGSANLTNFSQIGSFNVLGVTQ